MEGAPRDVVLRAPVSRALWTLAWPIIAANELMIVTSVIGLYWIGRFVGGPGLVADSLFRPINMLVGWFFMAGAVGGSVLVSRSIGARDGRGLAITASAATLTLALWAVTIAILLPISPWLAHALVGEDAASGAMLRLMIAWFVAALPLLSIADLLLEVANATGSTKFNLIRIGVDLAFVTALTPIAVHELGIAGAPIAEAASMIVLAAMLWLALTRRREELGLGALTRTAWRPRWDMWKELLAIGVPVQIGRMVMFGAQILLAQRVRAAGEAAVAGYGIAGMLMLCGSMITLALSQAGAVIVGQALGANDPERARHAARAGLIAVLATAAVFVVATLFAAPVIGLFSSDPKIQDAAMHALGILRWAAFGIGAWQVALAASAAHRKTMKPSTLLIIGEACGLLCALAWPHNALDGVCIAFILANVVKAALLGYMYVGVR